MNALYAGLLALSIVLIELLIGGTRLVFSLPSYGILTVAAILSLAAVGRKPARANIPCLVVSALFFGYILHRAAHSPWDYLWWMDFYQVIACLMVYLLTATILTETKHRTWIVITLLALAVVEFAFGLRQFANADDWMPLGLRRVGGGFRASGSLVHSIHYGGFMEAVGVFGFALAFWGKFRNWIRFIFGYIGVFCYAGVAISGSRGAYLSSVFSLAVFALLNFWIVWRVRREKFARVVAITLFGGTALVIAAGALMMKSPALKKRVSTMLNQDLKILDYAAAAQAGAKEKPPIDIRIYNWQAAWDQFHVSPVWGTGAGTHLYYGRLFRRPQLQPDPIHAHSDYLELLAEYGMVGAVGMGVFLLFHIGHGLRRFSSTLRDDFRGLTPYEPAQSNDLALSLGSLSAVAAYLAHSVVDFNLHIPGHAMIFAFIFGILASPRASGRQNPLALEIPFRLALPCLGVWMALSGLTKFAGEYWSEKARVALRDGQFVESIALAERALHNEPRNFEVLLRLGEARRNLALRTLKATDRRVVNESSLASFESALQLFPYDHSALVRRAQVLDELGRYVEARESYQKAIQNDPNLGVLYGYYAQHLFRVGRTEEGREAQRKAQSLSTDDLRKMIDREFLDAPVEPPKPAAPAQN
ncbi:MAG TPA: O-antigen ligase family protein [Chthoniobacteraceae bacterium]|nr:O-antigen ligase family protein [Chthoniobacteraceae bacterium]